MYKGALPATLMNEISFIVALFKVLNLLICAAQGPPLPCRVTPTTVPHKRLDWDLEQTSSDRCKESDLLLSWSSLALNLRASQD